MGETEIIYFRRHLQLSCEESTLLVKATLVLEVFAFSPKIICTQEACGHQWYLTQDERYRRYQVYQV